MGKGPPNISLAEIVAAMFNTGQAPEVTDVPSEATVPPAAQITPPTEEDWAAMKALAEEAAELDDQISALAGALMIELAEKKKALRIKMVSHNVTEVPIAGRGAAVLSVERKKETTKKALTAVVGPEQANDIWKKLGTKTSYSLSIPPRRPPEA